MMKHSPKTQTINRDWEGQTAVIVGGGPSLRSFDFSILNKFPQSYTSIGCNDSGLKARTSTLFSLDRVWIQRRMNQCAAFEGNVILGVDPGFDFHRFGVDGVEYIEKRRGVGLSQDPRWVFGLNTGFGALNLATLKGCKRIYLLGIDMKVSGGKKHWHQEYEWASIQHNSLYEQWMHEFYTAKKQLHGTGVDVYIVGMESEIHCFEKVSFLDFYAHIEAE